MVEFDAEPMTLTLGLVAWWPGDGDATDAAGGNHGTLHDGATFEPGLFGSAFSFDGLDDYVSIPDSASLDLADEITVSLWAKINGFPLADSGSNHSGYLIDKMISDPVGPFGIWVSRNEAVLGMFQTPQTPSDSGFGDWLSFTDTADLNNWHHYAMTYISGEQRAYYDGREVDSRPITGQLITNDLQIEIGSGVDRGYFFDGLIDEVRIYNRALSDAEIKATYDAGSAGTPTVFVAPTATPAPTAIAVPTPVPTATAAPTATLVAAATSVPKPAPTPTRAPKPTPAPLQPTGDFLTVTSTTDAVDANPGDGVCADGSGRCTLRAAIMEANAFPGVDGVNLPAGMYTLAISGIGEDAAQTGDLDITDHLRITGADRATTIIDGGGEGRVFDIHLGTTVDIVAVTIRNGNLSEISGGPSEPLSSCTTTNGGLDSAGGGVKNVATLTLADSSVSNNSAGLGMGGGITNKGSLTITNSVISGNTASYSGGIHNFSNGTVDITDSTVSGNTVCTLSGGIGNLAIANITNSTIRDNTAGQGGAGICACGGGGRLTIINSTVSGNNAGGGGGGISNSSGTLTIVNSTVSGNIAQNGGGIYQSSISGFNISNSTVSGNVANNVGGGIANVAGGGTLKNTIIALNLSGGDCSGDPLASLGHNLDSDGDCNLTDPADLSQTDPLLGPLQDNGGPTFTNALLPGSPAIGAGDDASCPDTDQRGVARPQGTACDIGALEVKGGAAAAGPIQAETIQANIQNFTHQDLTLQVGDTVVWIQQDQTIHTTRSGLPTAPDGVWNSDFLSNGQTFSFTFTEAGTFPYFCAIHPSMTATVTVVEESGSPVTATPTLAAVEVLYSIPLSPGWNFISLPRHPIDTNLDSVFAGTGVSKVLSWTEDGLRAYGDPSEPPSLDDCDQEPVTSTGCLKASRQQGEEFLGSLTEIRGDTAYWVHTGSFAPIQVGLDFSLPLSIPQLNAGWNLVPVSIIHPGVEPGTRLDADDAFGTANWTLAISFIALDQLEEPLVPGGGATVVVGRGYWLWVTNP